MEEGDRGIGMPQASEWVWRRVERERRRWWRSAAADSSSWWRREWILLDNGNPPQVHMP